MTMFHGLKSFVSHEDWISSHKHRTV